MVTITVRVCYAVCVCIKIAFGSLFMRLLGFVGGFVMWFDFDVDCGV